jgi:hypothetical protein
MLLRQRRQKKDLYQANRIDEGLFVHPDLIEAQKKDLHQGNTLTKVSPVHENRPVVPGIKPY